LDLIVCSSSDHGAGGFVCPFRILPAPLVFRTCRRHLAGKKSGKSAQFRTKSFPPLSFSCFPAFLINFFFLISVLKKSAQIREICGLIFYLPAIPAFPAFLIKIPSFFLY
jgi:hypothetical protein